MMRTRSETLLLSGAPVPGDGEMATLVAGLRGAVVRQDGPAGAVEVLDVTRPEAVAWLTETGLALPDADVAAGLAPVEPLDMLIALDMAGMLWQPHLRRRAVLAPTSFGAALAAMQADADPLALLARLQAVLRHTGGVAVFDGAQARTLALVGAGPVALLPWPEPGTGFDEATEARLRNLLEPQAGTGAP